MRKRLVLFILVALGSGAFANPVVRENNVKKIGVQSPLQLEIAPGAVSRELVVNFSEAGSNLSITITDLKGVALLNKQVETGSVKASINVSKLESGSYFVVLSNGEARTSKLFTKQ